MLQTGGPLLTCVGASVHVCVCVSVHLYMCGVHAHLCVLSTAGYSYQSAESKEEWYIENNVLNFVWSCVSTELPSSLLSPLPNPLLPQQQASSLPTLPRCLSGPGLESGDVKVHKEFSGSHQLWQDAVGEEPKHTTLLTCQW